MNTTLGRMAAATALTAAALTSATALAPAAFAGNGPGTSTCVSTGAAKKFTGSGMHGNAEVDVYTYTRGKVRTSYVHGGLVRPTTSTGRAHSVSGVMYVQVDGGKWQGGKKFSVVVNGKPRPMTSAGLTLSTKYIGHHVRSVVAVGGHYYTSPSVRVGSGGPYCGA